VISKEEHPMSLMRKAAREMLTRFSSFIAVVLRGPTVLADASRPGRRAGLPALAGLILGGTLSRLLSAVSSRPNDARMHIQVLPDTPARLDEHYDWVTSRWGGIRLKDESRPRRRCRQLTEDCDRARAALASARTGPLSAAQASGIHSFVVALKYVSGRLSARWAEISRKHEGAALTLAETGPLFVRLAPMRTCTSRRVAQVGWTG
jgi:hypothetical protein